MKVSAWLSRWRPDLVIGLAVLLINLFVFLLAGWWMRADWLYRHNVSMVTVQNLCAVLTESIAGEINRLDIGLAAIADEVSGPEPRRDPSVLREILLRLHNRLPQLESLQITDADGRGLVDTDSGEIPSVADQAHFIALRDAANPDVVLSKPLLGRVSKKWVLVLARRINAPDGRFAGIVSASLPVARLNILLSGLELGPGGAVGVRDADLGVIARYPEMVNGTAAVGDSSISQKLRQEVAAHPQAGSYQALASLDGIERVLTYRRVGSYPLTVVVGLSVQAYRTQWWRDSLRLGGLVAAFTVMTLLGARLLAAERRSRREAYVRLEDSRAELERFAGMLAQHLQEPARLQETYAQRLQQLLPPSLQGDMGQALESILAGTSRLRALLRDARFYLSVAHLAESGPPARPDAAVDLALARLAPQLAAAAGTRIDRRPLPPVALGEGPLTEIFFALLENALEYRHPERPCHIALAAEQRGREVLLTVTDNGLGIAPELRQRVFDVFERANPLRDREQTGIGLAVARKIVLGAGGRIWIEDGESGGICVCLALPAAKGG